MTFRVNIVDSLCISVAKGRVELPKSVLESTKEIIILIKKFAKRDRDTRTLLVVAAARYLFPKCT